MSDYILCQVKRASLPFYVENISKNIYSIEELCYYFYKNIYLIDESIINERLCNWLKDELGLSKLYEKLYRIWKKKRERVHLFWQFSVRFIIFPMKNLRN